MDFLVNHHPSALVQHHLQIISRRWNASAKRRRPRNKPDFRAIAPRGVGRGAFWCSRCCVQLWFRGCERAVRPRNLGVITPPAPVKPRHKWVQIPPSPPPRRPRLPGNTEMRGLRHVRDPERDNVDVVHGPMAQLVARLVRIEEVRGSNPLRSTGTERKNLAPHLAGRGSFVGARG